MRGAVGCAVALLLLVTVDGAFADEPPNEWYSAEAGETLGADADQDPTLARPWRLPPLPFVHPRVFEAHTARILPAAAMYTGANLDTGANAGAIGAFGLGDVADFAVSFTDLVRARPDANTNADAIAPYVTATLRIGLDESWLFPHQPAVAVGYRKSFARETDGFETRVAELFLVTSTSLGDAVSIHVGGSLWDAELIADGSSVPVYLHDEGLTKQIRGNFGIEVDAATSAQIMLESYWVPEFRYDARKIALTARFAFGVRYALADWAVVESGVSVPDVESRDLLEAQIFGRLRFTSHKLARPYQEAK